MNDREGLHLPDHSDFSKPITLLIGELFPGPLQRRGRHRIHAIETVIARSIFIMIPFYDWPVIFAHTFQTSRRVRVVANDVSHTNVVSTPLLRSVR